jgi:L-seryl-tRNA(Ser) seleniumtransferase
LIVDSEGRQYALQRHMHDSEKINPQNDTAQSLLRKLPGVDHILEGLQKDAYFDEIPKSVVVRSIRAVIDRLRHAILGPGTPVDETDLSETAILAAVKERVSDKMAPNLTRTINATGIVVHTNLGRSQLSPEAIDHMAVVASRYSNLEFDLQNGERGSRYVAVDGILCELCGAEATMVVNNNAGAVLVCLDTIAAGKQVVVSRGELVEIGGSFRIPDVMAKSGGILKEVGTTNRTHLRDYESAIGTDTGLLLKIHRSNYSIVGFTAEVTLKELAALGRKHAVPVMEDLGSGTLIDFSKYGLRKEPTVQESVRTGADVITFSGDKLLGGPQAGIIVGKKEILEKIKKNPLTRALRIDKLTLAALESTLRQYWDETKAVHHIPTLRMLTVPISVLEKRAGKLLRLLKKIDTPRLRTCRMECVSRSGGGALPTLDLPSRCIGIAVEDMSANAIEKWMRANRPPIIGRIENDLFLMDVRTLQDDELPTVHHAFENLLKRSES